MFLQDSQNRGPLRFTSMRLETGSRFGFYLRLGKCQGFGRQLVRAFEVLESSDVGFAGGLQVSSCRVSRPELVVLN